MHLFPAETTTYREIEPGVFESTVWVGETPKSQSVYRVELDGTETIYRFGPVDDQGRRHGTWKYVSLIEGEDYFDREFHHGLRVKR